MLGHSFALPADAEVHGDQLVALLRELASQETPLSHGIYEHVGKPEGERDKYLLHDSIIMVEARCWGVLYSSQYLPPDGPGQYVRPRERFDERFVFVGVEL
jgi:hypothetical protein